MKTGLVLEGGGMRGMFSAGVLDVLMDEQISFDAVTGVSAGALFGVNFLSGQRGRALRYNMNYGSYKEYMGLYPLLKEGNIVGTDFAYNKVPRELDVFDNEAFKKSNIPFYAVVTNVATGKPEYIQITDIFEQMDTLRASASMPMVSKNVKINGNEYLDGGISDSIPTTLFENKGFDKIVVILTRDINYRKKPTSKLVLDLFLSKYPKIKEQMLLRHINYNDKIERLLKLEKEGRIFIIRPEKPLTIGRTEAKKEALQETYDIGVKACRDNIDSLKKYLSTPEVHLIF